MSLAPTPGVGARVEAANNAKMTVTITIRGESHRVAPQNVPMGEQEICFNETGRTFEDLFVQPIGLIKLARLWWMARRLNGERSLRWVTVRDEFPTDLNEDEISVEVDEPDARPSDPEA